MKVMYEQKTHRNDFGSLVVTSVDDAWHPVYDKDYIEWWYFDSFNDDKSIVRGAFYIMGNPSQSSNGRAGVRFFIVRPEGNELFMDEAFPLSSFSASKDKCEVRIGKNYLEGEPDRYSMHVESDERTLDLEFASSLRGVKPSPEGKAYFSSNDRFMAWVVPQPRADAKGTLTSEGSAWDISGCGYHDHNWSNIPFIDYLTDWYWGRVGDEKFTIIFAKINTSKKFNNSSIKTLTIYNENRIIYATSESAKWDLEGRNFKVDPLTGVRYPEAYSLSVTDQELSLDFSFSVEKLFGRMDILEGHNFLAKWFIRTLKKVNPFSLAFVSRGHGEIAHRRKRNSLRGTVVHELVNLKK